MTLNLSTFTNCVSFAAVSENSNILAWLSVLGLLVALVAFAYWTRAGIIARATTKEAIRQPLFFLLMMIAVVVLLLNMVMPFFTLQDDVRMQKECGLATLLIAGAFLAVWTAGNNITNEITDKTAITLLSKPITRRQFVLGKYMGIVQTVLWMYVALSAVLFATVFYKVGDDQQDRAEDVTPYFEWHTVAGGVEFPLPHAERMAVVADTIPGIALGFMQVCVLAAISVAIATRLPMVVNLVATFTIFVVGNLVPVIVEQSEGREGNEAVTFTARLISAVFPSLASFNVSTAMATGASVPNEYLGMTFLYSVAYIAAVITVGFLLFEDRDLS